MLFIKTTPCLYFYSSCFTLQDTAIALLSQVQFCPLVTGIQLDLQLVPR